MIVEYDNRGRITRLSPDGADGVWIPQSLADQMAPALSLYRVVDGVLVTRDGEPVAIVPDVPATLTSSQAKRALVHSDLYEAIESYVTAIEEQPKGILYRIMWDAPTWYRHSPELNQIATDFGLTSEQIDDLFRFAGTL